MDRVGETERSSNIPVGTRFIRSGLACELIACLRWARACALASAPPGSRPLAGAAEAILGVSSYDSKLSLSFLAGFQGAGPGCHGLF